MAPVAQHFRLFARTLLKGNGSTLQTSQKPGKLWTIVLLAIGTGVGILLYAIIHFCIVRRKKKKGGK
jgi:phage shock protein PspC (stress-responsive transcriptional regulator)